MSDSYIVYVAAPLLTFVAYFVLPWLTSSLKKYPGPALASWSRLWLAHKSRYGVRSVTVHEEHMKHGKFVRIGPNEGESPARAEAVIPSPTRAWHLTPKDQFPSPTRQLSPLCTPTAAAASSLTFVRPSISARGVLCNR